MEYGGARDNCFLSMGPLHYLHHRHAISCLLKKRIFVFFQYVFLFAAIDGSIQEVERHLELGKQFLSKGQFSDALSHYHAAVGKRPDLHIQTV